jgi:hypothetical protein
MHKTEPDSLHLGQPSKRKKIIRRHSTKEWERRNYEALQRREKRSAMSLRLPNRVWNWTSLQAVNAYGTDYLINHWIPIRTPYQQGEAIWTRLASDMVFVPRYQSCVSFNVVRNHGTPILSIFEGSLACASLFDSARNDLVPSERLRIFCFKNWNDAKTSFKWRLSLISTSARKRVIGTWMSLARR